MRPAVRSRALVGGAAVAATLLAGGYLAAGGASYEPAEVADPCQPRAWRSPEGLKEIAEQFTLSALDGAACELGVTRETLARALASEEARERFAERYGIDDAKLEEAVHAGLVRAIDDAEDAGALSPFLAVPLRELAQRVPVEEGIALLNDASPLFEDAQGLLELFGNPSGRAWPADPLISSTGGIRPPIGRIPPSGEGQSRVARQTQSTARGCRGRRAQSGQPGTVSSPLICSRWTAMWMLAGKTEISRPISHQRARGRVRGEVTAAAPAISARPLITTDSRWAGKLGGIIAS